MKKFRFQGLSTPTLPPRKRFCYDTNVALSVGYPDDETRSLVLEISPELGAHHFHEIRKFRLEIKWIKTFPELKSLTLYHQRYFSFPVRNRTWEKFRTIYHFNFTRFQSLSAIIVKHCKWKVPSVTTGLKTLPLFNWS